MDGDGGSSVLSYRNRCSPTAVRIDWESGANEQLQCCYRAPARTPGLTQLLNGPVLACMAPMTNRQGYVGKPRVVTKSMHKEDQAITTPGETLALDATRSAWYAAVIWSLCAFAMR